MIFANVSLSVIVNVISAPLVPNAGFKVPLSINSTSPNLILKLLNVKRGSKVSLKTKDLSSLSTTLIVPL